MPLIIAFIVGAAVAVIWDLALNGGGGHLADPHAPRLLCGHRSRPRRRGRRDGHRGHDPGPVSGRPHTAYIRGKEDVTGTIRQTIR